jgi:TRAP-type C4-dicarboxylate transport system substrate-binding protein
VAGPDAGPAEDAAGRGRQVLRRHHRADALKDEAELVDFFKAQGLEIYTPDVAAFRKHVLDVYAKSKWAKEWTPGMLERINAL